MPDNPLGMWAAYERRGELREGSAQREEEIEQEAIDLALNDCQMWDNLPESAREFYRREAAEELVPED